MTGHALVVGKFYPPHRGHRHLVEEAARNAERVTVLVMASSAETIPLADRVRWMRAGHAQDPRITVTGVNCDAPYDLGSEAVWAAQVDVMRQAVRQATGLPVDLVASGEDYGSELARRFGAAELRIDRTLGPPASGTACRADLAAHWDDLYPAARAGLVTRVVVLGSESTGTTTVSRALAERFRERGGVWARTQWVPEHGREATLGKFEQSDEIVWTGEDFAEIAVRQSELEDDAAAHSSPLLVCDTDSFATQVWERRYMGRGSAHARAANRRRPQRPDVYLLTDHVGVPFAQDGIRDGEHIRAEMTQWFRDALASDGRSWVLLTGPLKARVDLAVRVADQMLAIRSRFGEPILPE